MSDGRKRIKSATLETEFRNGVGSLTVRGNSPSIGGWIV